MDAAQAIVKKEENEEVSTASSIGSSPERFINRELS